MKKIIWSLFLLAWFQVNGDAMGTLPEKFTIPLGGVAGFTLPGAGAAGADKLAFEARIAVAKFRSGAAPALEILVNGLPLSADRLLNKGDFFHFRADQLVPWVRDGSRITVGYYPWDEVRGTMDKQFIHAFVFDLSGLLRSDAPNKIEFINRFQAFKDSALEFRNVRFGALTRYPVSPTLRERAPRSMALQKLRHQASSWHRGALKSFPPADDYDTFQMPDLVQPGRQRTAAFEATDDARGTIRIHTGGETVTLRSEWRVRGSAVTLRDNQGDNGALQVARRLQRTADGLTVYDTLSNRTDAKLPVVFDHAATVELERLREFRLCGTARPTFTANTDNLVSREYAMTPLIYLGYAHGGLGIYLEDERYRNQYSMLAVDETLHLADDLFYLEPRQSYTVVWRLFPVAGDYYTLLNTLRKSYRLYQNIPGLFGFVYPFPGQGGYERYYRKKLDSADKVQEFLNASGIQFPATLLDEPGFYGNEPTASYRAAVRGPAVLRDQLKKLESSPPLLLYTDVHLLRTAGDHDIDGRTRWQERLQDSVVRDSFGRTVPYRTGTLYHVAPRLDNASGRQLMTNISAVLDEENFGGVFLDEWNHSNARVAYNLSDRTSALLDEHGDIKQEIAIIPLYSQEFLLALGRKVTANRRVAFANQYDCTPALMQLPLIHFAEPVAHEACYLIRAAQAGRTPLTLSCKRNTTAWSDVKYFLRYGVLVCYYATRIYGDHVLKRLYPITVQELYPGMVIGTDRILTNRSGRYSLGTDRKLTARIYRDPDGGFVKKITAHGIVELNIDPEREVALIQVEP